jgi:hypothetical protein
MPKPTVVSSSGTHQIERTRRLHGKRTLVRQPQWASLLVTIMFIPHCMPLEAHRTARPSSPRVSEVSRRRHSLPCSSSRLTDPLPNHTGSPVLTVLLRERRTPMLLTTYHRRARGDPDLPIPDSNNTLYGRRALTFVSYKSTNTQRCS